MQSITKLLAGTILIGLFWLADTNRMQAGWLGFKNELKIPVLIQSVEMKSRPSRSEAPFRLYPGETTWNRVRSKSTYWVTIIQQGKTRKILHRFRVKMDNQDKYYIIRESRGRVTVMPSSPPRVSRNR